MPGAVGMGLANWNWRVVHQFVADRFGISLNRSLDFVQKPVTINQ